ncbi:GNAT family N-acetyltransferase [Bacillus massiliglaciei]|uniref:GNAT family N-acetyltransferase n=1 Tax=Bacillus massiliglaciei TaxID=1816693 RepID=UPI000B16C1C9|nr:GNAT family N-acetyltransferase [Bacillus massiliglaciei]
MEIRLFTNEDLQQCTETFVEVFDGEPWNDNWTCERASQYLSDFIDTPGFKGIIAAEEGIVIGFLFGIRKRWWSGDEFFIHEMCVRLEYQRKGTGKRLLEFLRNELADNNISSLSLLTDRGIPAERFYLKNGFKEIERLVFLSKNVHS